MHPMRKFADATGNVPGLWSVKPWVVYLFTDADVTRSIDYVRQNLERAMLPPQQYEFVVPYAGRTRGAVHRR
jgi:hypothetical protein